MYPVIAVGQTISLLYTSIHATGMYDTGASSVYSYGQTRAPWWPRRTAGSACFRRRGAHVVRDHTARDAGVGDRKPAGSAPSRSDRDIQRDAVSSVYEPQGALVSIKHKVGQLDVGAARLHVVTIVKPATPNSAERAPSVLKRMAARGPRYRVGLVPSITNRRWDFSDEPGSWCTQSLDISGQHSMQEILDHVVGHRLVAPISVSQAGEYLCVACDHGLGDSHFIWEVCAALTHGNTDTGFVEPLAAATMTNPFVSALFDAAKSTPRLFARTAIGLWKPAWSFFRSYLVALVNRPRAVPSRPAGDQDERYVAVWSKSGPGFIEEVRRYRDSKHPSASVNAILMLSICRALQECGASLHDHLEVLVDLRRFLPRDNFTFANFPYSHSLGYRFAALGGRFSESLRLKVGSLDQLFKLAGYLAVDRVRMLSLDEAEKPSGLFVDRPNRLNRF